MGNLWLDRPITVSGIEIGAGQATLHVLTSYGAAQDIQLRTNDDGLVDRFEVSLQPPEIKSWRDIDAELTKSGARYSYQVSKVTDGRCSAVAGTNTDLSLPLASIFKLYVLLAVADAVKAGTLHWTDQLTITEEAKAVGSAGLDELPPGAEVSVRKAAQQMISASDNMATDLLIARLTPGAVERALVAAGHHDPASMTPFPTMHELFSIGWGEPDLREQWKQATPAGPSAAAGADEFPSIPTRPGPHQHARIHLRRRMVRKRRRHLPRARRAAGRRGRRGGPGKGHPVRVPGIDLDESKWVYIGAKAGNLPGDMTFSWYAVDRTGQPWVVSFQLNWPRFNSNDRRGLAPVDRARRHST